jgi:hypothetical protein
MIDDASELDEEQIVLGAFNIDEHHLTAPQLIQLEDMTPIKLWECIVYRLKPHAMHYAHDSIFTPDPREDRKELGPVVGYL